MTDKKHTSVVLGQGDHPPTDMSEIEMSHRDSNPAGQDKQTVGAPMMENKEYET